MSVIIEFSIPAEDFILGKALQQTSGLTVELEKVTPTGGAAIPYFWVIGEGHEQFDSVLAREPALSSFEVVDEVDGRWLYRAEWDASVDTFLQTIVAHDVVLQEAGGNGESWEFQLRFPGSHRLSEFHTACKEKGIDLEVESVYNPVQPDIVVARNMTDGQRALVEHMYDGGYFDIPRKTTLAGIADELGLSDQAVNERLRRGLSTLIETTLKSKTEREP